MQIVLAGATGKAGGQALKQCLKDERITKVVVLSRRELTDSIFSDAKIEVILHQDFSQYPESLLERLSGVSACIWAIGGRVPQFDGDVEKCRRANVDFPVAAAKAMSGSLASKAPDGKFRFVFCSGQMAEWDQDKKLYFMEDSRKIKGLAEKSLSNLADESPKTLEVYYLEPSGFIDEKAGPVTKMVAPLYGGISEVQVGKALVKVALDGYKTRLVTNSEMQKL